MDGVKYVSTFSLKGNWVKTERKTKPADVPDSARQGFNATKYNGAKVLSVKEITRPQQPTPLYLFEVRYNNYDDDKVAASADYKLYITVHGVLTKEEQEPEQALQGGLPWGGQ
jgi:hypothetical protein